jgi:ornithine cyclodeaminase/alanine dehydrogenase-like protein (mu-crystallin family)
MSHSLGIEVIAASKAEDAVRGADIVCEATHNQNEPAVQGQWIEKGTHVNSIGAVNAFDDELIKRSRVVLSEKSQVIRCIPPRAQFDAMLQNGTLTEEEVSIELSDVLVGREAGRRDSSQITLFFSSGSPMWDVAIANRLYQLARERGIGKEISVGD